jgi:hypothetical protein
MAKIRKFDFLFVTFLLFVCLAACSKIGICYVESSEGSVSDSSDIRVNYFFDRTESIRPFTYKRDTGYSLAMSSLLTVGQDLFGSDPLSFYDVAGILRHTTALPEQLQVEIQKPAFYVPDPPRFPSDFTESVIVVDGLSQPFFTVAEYIRKNCRGDNELNIITTDLYEQNDISQHFHTFFRNAFARGMSGAIYAVNSEFRGNIYNITGNNRYLYVDGYSTLFVFMTGRKDIIEKYCAAYSKKLTEKNIAFNSLLFLLGDVSLDSVLLESVTAGNPRTYESAERSGKMINLRQAANTIRVWEETQPAEGKKKASYVSRVAGIEAYRPITNLDPQYVKYIDVKSADIAPTIETVSLEYFNGTGKTSEGHLSEFKSESPETILTSAAFEKDGVWYLAIRINGQNLKSGYYRVSYNIMPDWVLALDAGDGADGYDILKASNQYGERVKVLHLKSIFQSIQDDFNKENGFGGVFYLVKE